MNKNVYNLFVSYFNEKLSVKKLQLLKNMYTLLDKSYMHMDASFFNEKLCEKSIQLLRNMYTK